MAWIRITHASGEAHSTICQILASVGCEKHDDVVFYDGIFNENCIGDDAT